MSRYYLDDADVESQKRLFEEYAAEARRMLDARLPVPAHIYVLRCSHTFNVLDSRGAVSTTERAKAFGRMRTLAREVAQLWAERRTELDHPLGIAELPGSGAGADRVPGHDGTRQLLFEIGTEELPPSEVTRTAEAVRKALTEKLAATRLGHGDITTYATPRRVVAFVDRRAGGRAGRRAGRPRPAEGRRIRCRGQRHEGGRRVRPRPGRRGRASCTTSRWTASSTSR